MLIDLLAALDLTDLLLVDRRDREGRDRLGGRDLRARAGPFSGGQGVRREIEKFMIGFDIGGYKISRRVGRDGVRHRHPAAGRLREDARPG